MNFDEYRSTGIKQEFDHLCDEHGVNGGYLNQFLRKVYEAGQSHPVGFEKMKTEFGISEFNRGVDAGQVVMKASSEESGSKKIVLTIEEIKYLYDDIMSRECTIDIENIRKEQVK